MIVMWSQAMIEEKKLGFSQYNIEGKALEAFLGPLESNIMEAIWGSKKTPITVREIHAALNKTKKIAYTTVMSTMDRLFEKDLLDRKIEKGRGGLYYVYWPKLEKQKLPKISRPRGSRKLDRKFRRSGHQLPNRRNQHGRRRTQSATRTTQQNKKE